MEFQWQPREGLIRQYVDTFSPCTDAPRQFHVFSALALMASIVGRRVWIRDGAHRLYLNLFVLLLAPSSLYRKSTCVAIAQDCARSLEGRPENREDAAPGSERILFPNQFTPESLLDILKEQPAGLLTIDEFRMFLDSLKRDYNSGLRELFMSLYDCRGVHRKIRSQEVRVDSPCVSLLSACATGWFTEAFRAGEIRSGFYPRLCMVPAWSKTRHMARGQAPDLGMQADIRRRLAKLRQNSGELALTEKLESFFGDWALAQQRTIEGSDFEAELASFYTRLERVTLKIAGLLTLAEDPTRREISTTSLGDAINLTTWLQQNLRRLFSEEVTWGRGDEDVKKVLTRVAKQPGIGRRDLMRRTHLSAKDFEAALETLSQRGDVVSRDKGYFPSQPSQGVASAPVTAQVVQLARVR